NGIHFVAAAGTSEFAKRWKPQPGDIVSFKHHGYLLSSKKPKFPSLYRLRSDMTWDQVAQNWKEQRPTPKCTLPPFLFNCLSCCTLFSALPLRKAESKSKPRGYYSSATHRRDFFLRFAADAGFDP